MSPAVSVVLPTFNRAASLPAAIRSVLSQSFVDFELIVVDDASTEDIATVVRGLDDPRVRYVRREVNGGAAAARNTGLKLARGRYVAFQDSDDLWLPGKLERQVRLLGSLPEHVGAVTGGKILHGRDDRWNYGPGKVAYVPNPEQTFRLDEDQLARALAHNLVSVQCATFRRDCLPGDDWFDPRLRANEDWALSIRLARTAKVYLDAEPVVVSTISRDSISTNRRRDARSILRIYLKNRSLFLSHRKESSRILLTIATKLRKLGKRRQSRRFVIEALKVYPRSALFLIRLAARTLAGQAASSFGHLRYRMRANTRS